MLLQNIKKISIFSILFLVMWMPLLLSAQGTGIVYVCVSGAPGECDFNDLIMAVTSVVNWATIFAIQFSVIVIAYAGFKYMISGDKPAERSAANAMMLKVVKGMALILLAWVIVRLILSALQVDPNIPQILN